MESFRARQVELESKKSEIEEKWKTAKCVSSIGVALPDWGRRIDVGDFPAVACGSSSGNIFVANLESGEIIAQTKGEELREPLEDVDKVLRILYSGYDGGGTIAIAMYKNLICSAGRQGGVQIWRFDDQNPRLISQGNMQALEGKFVTCLKLDEDYLWVARSDGRLQAFAHRSPELPLALQIEPEFDWQFDSAILSLSLSPEIGYGVVTTASGCVELFSMEDDESVVSSWMPPLDSGIFRQSANSYILASEIVPTKEGGYIVACGSTDGSLHLQPLRWTKGMLDEDEPFKMDKATECKPKHRGPLKCLASPSPGLLLSAGQDGSMRLWNITEDDPSYVYQFVGYKVWIGSLWTDGKRIVSDGADNTIVMHDFASEAEEDK
jgi:WD40 repeat protein